MRRERVAALLAEVAAGKVSADAALDRLSLAPVERLSFATVDHHRALRQGYPEVVLAEGKTADQVVIIAAVLARRDDGFLVTRATPEVQERLSERIPGVVTNRLGRTAYLPPEVAPAHLGRVLVVTAGTSDLAVAEEAAVTAAAVGCEVDRLTDVGVAGIHRLLDQSALLHSADVVIVAAGMDGALPSVVGGLVRQPVIAVPTSVGYGASFGGLAALLGMLNSCAAGIVVVNIDNGFGAAMAAARILHGATRQTASGAVTQDGEAGTVTHQ
ncbi:MAG: nickel pincer cofactor biosynthesis protein LarB [Gemmatimonadaceae bacterium]